MAKVSKAPATRRRMAIRRPDGAPWTKEQFSNFMELATKRPDRPYNQLAENFLSTTEEEFADAQWNAMSAHPVGSALLKRSEVVAILALQDSARERAKSELGERPNYADHAPADYIPLATLTRYNSKLKLLQTIALFAHWGWEGGWKKPPSYATAKQRLSAMKHAKALMLALKRGVQLPGSSLTTDKLRDGLSDLIDHLSVRSKTKIRQGGDDAARRIFLEQLAYHLIVACGWCQPLALVRFSELVGMQRDTGDEALAKRINTASWKRWEEFANQNYGESLRNILGPRAWDS